MPHSALIRPIRDWLIDQSLGEPDIVNLFQELCQRLSGIGLPITRGRLIWQTLHPLFGAETVIWDSGEESSLEQFPHQDGETKQWVKSPLRFVLDNKLKIFRRRLTGPDATVDFGMLEDLKTNGFTDYLVLATPMQTVDLSNHVENAKPRGILVSWATDREDGFSEDDLYALQSIQRVLAVLCKSVIQTRISENIATTYLGVRAGRNVLDGQIRRGDGQETSAVVWYSDLRNSTMFAETLPAGEYFSMLNAYFEVTAGSLVEHGGEVLDFIGDAVLGIFPYEDDKELEDASERATAALDKTLAMGRENNLEREKEGLDRYNFGVGLNVGALKFGNIGIPQRLSFSVIGSTVNEVARIEGMTKLLQQPVLSGGTLAELQPDRWRSVGAHKLDGVLDPVELYAFKKAS